MSQGTNANQRAKQRARQGSLQRASGPNQPPVAVQAKLQSAEVTLEGRFLAATLSRLETGLTVNMNWAQAGTPHFRMFADGFKMVKRAEFIDLVFWEQGHFGGTGATFVAKFTRMALAGWVARTPIMNTFQAQLEAEVRKLPQGLEDEPTSSSNEGKLRPGPSVPVHVVRPSFALGLGCVDLASLDLHDVARATRAIQDRTEDNVAVEARIEARITLSVRSLHRLQSAIAALLEQEQRVGGDA